jgi:hypothetical protein
MIVSFMVSVPETVAPAAAPGGNEVKSHIIWYGIPGTTGSVCVELGELAMSLPIAHLEIAPRGPPESEMVKMQLEPLTLHVGVPPKILPKPCGVDVAPDLAGRFVSA